jgi:hypothetical protein
LVHIQRHNLAMPNTDQEIFPDKMKFKNGHLWVLMTTQKGKQKSDKLLLEKIRGNMPQMNNEKFEKQVKIDFKYQKRKDTPFKFWTNLYEHPKVASKMIVGLRDRVQLTGSIQKFMQKLHL